MPRPQWGPALIVTGKIVVENGLHLLDGLELGSAALDPEMLVVKPDYESS